MRFDPASGAAQLRYFLTSLRWGRLSAAQILAVVRMHWAIEALAVAPGGRTVAVGRSDGVYERELGGKQGERLLVPGRELAPDSLEFSGDGKWLAVGYRDEVIVWSVAAAAAIAILPIGQSSHYLRDYRLHFSRSRQFLAFADGGNLHVWRFGRDSLAGEVKLEIPEDPSDGSTAGGAVAFLDEDTLAVGGRCLTHLVALDEGRTARSIGCEVEHIDIEKRIAVSQDGRWLASACADSSRIRRLPGGAVDHALSTWPVGFWDVAFGPHGRLAAASDSGVFLWKEDPWHQERLFDCYWQAREPWEHYRDTIRPEPMASEAAARSVPGRWLASERNGTRVVANLDGSITVRHHGGEKKLAGNPSGVVALALSPNGRLLAWAGADGTLSLWDLKAGAALATVEMATDGRWVVLGRDHRVDGSPGAEGLIFWEAGDTCLPGFVAWDMSFTPGLLARLARNALDDH